MFLDGDKVARGDRVYHLSAGMGTVETLEQDVARVKMDSGGVLNMHEDGYVGRRKLFFWFAPKYIMPRKGKEAVHDKAFAFAATAVELLLEVEGG